jgi:hypothetical protein
MLVLFVIVVGAAIVFYRHRSLQRNALPLASIPTAHAPRRSISFDAVLFGLALLVFLATRLIGLDKFPIYFFTDEAVNTVQAADFIHHDFRDSNGQLFPTYFQNDRSFSLSVSVYAQVIPYALFGYSVFATRATDVLIAFTGMIAVGLILRNIFKIRFWWVGVLLLSITPAWFLNSRTAFEHVLWVAFFAWFLYFYLQYRQDRPRYVWLTLLAAALVFYSYNGAQLGLGVTGLLLLLIDARYHWRTLRRNPRVACVALILVSLLAVPYLRFQATHPNETSSHLALLDSYWLKDISLGEKISQLGQEYAFGLQPDYWYTPNNPRDLIRHQMKGYGNLLLITLPFALIGLLITLKNFRSPSHRVLLIALLTSPLGGTLAAASVQRDMVFVIPAALLTAIGLAAGLGLLIKHIDYRRLAVGLFTLLAVGHAGMLVDALTNGPLWYDNYGLYGLQYGGKEVFRAINTYHQQSPQTSIIVFPDKWLNGPGAVMRFFVPDGSPVYLLNFDDYMARKQNLSDNDLLVLCKEEYQQLVDSHKFADLRVEETLPMPDQTPGFYFLRLRYSPEADAIFAAEKAARRQLLEESIPIDGETVITRHSQFDIGRIQDVFDGRPETLARTVSANPALIEIIYPTPHRLTGLILTSASRNFRLTVQLFTDETTAPITYTQTYLNQPPDPTVTLNFDPAPALVKKIHLELQDTDDGEEAHLHIREIKLTQ